jgi:hypothetical protein
VAPKDKAYGQRTVEREHPNQKHRLDFRRVHIKERDGDARLQDRRRQARQQANHSHENRTRSGLADMVPKPHKQPGVRGETDHLPEQTCKNAGNGRIARHLEGLKVHVHHQFLCQLTLLLVVRTAPSKHADRFVSPGGVGLSRSPVGCSLSPVPVEALSRSRAGPSRISKKASYGKIVNSVFWSRCLARLLST